MEIKFILKCDNEECENYMMFVNEAVFINEDSANTFQERFGLGSEDPDDFCPVCGQLAFVEDVIEQYRDAHAIEI